MTMRNDTQVLAKITLRGGAVAELTPMGWKCAHLQSQELLNLDQKQFPPPIYAPDWVAWTVERAIDHLSGTVNYIRPYQDKTLPGQII